jgi:hypothetical protein
MQTGPVEARLEDVGMPNAFINLAMVRTPADRLEFGGEPLARMKQTYRPPHGAPVAPLFLREPEPLDESLFLEGETPPGGHVSGPMVIGDGPVGEYVFRGLPAAQLPKWTPPEED